MSSTDDGIRHDRPLRIALLSQKATRYSTRRLLQAAHSRGHEAVVLDYLRCSVQLTVHKPSLSLDGQPLIGLDAVLPRISASSTFYGCSVVRQLEGLGVYTPNSALAIARGRDKLRALQVLVKRGIPIPVTAFGHSTQHVEELIEAVGGAPLVVKLLEGTQGIGVVLCETRKAAASVIQAFRNLQANILVQEYVQEAAGMDLRCLVVGQRVVAAMTRQAPEGEFRANLHRGGTAAKARLTPEERSVAVRAARAMNLGVAGVDLLRSSHGPLVLEVNSSPGARGHERATGVDVAGLIVRHIERHAPTGAKADRVSL